MRQLQCGRVKDHVIEKQNIDIDQAWAVVKTWCTPERCFKPLQMQEQWHRFHISLGHHRLVQKRRLVLKTPWWRLIYIGFFLHHHLRPEIIDCSLKIGKAIADVTAQREVNSMVHG